VPAVQRKISRWGKLKHALLKKRSAKGGIILLMVVCFVYGIFVGRYQVFPYRPLQRVCSGLSRIFIKEPIVETQGYAGRWFPLRKARTEKGSSQEDALEKIGTLPYLKGYTSPKNEWAGVTTYDDRRAYDGATLFCSGHAPVVLLIDMEGDVLHQWEIPFERVWPNPLPFPIYDEHTQFIRRARVYPNGDILCVFEYIGVVKLDKYSRVLWHYDGQNHHDIDVTKNGTIYTLGREKIDVREAYPMVPFSGPVYDDFIVLLTPDGEEIKKVSVFEAFYHSPYAAYLEGVEKIEDIFHTNTIERMEGPILRNHPMFNEGDVLISIRNINTIAVIDGKEDRVKWALTGMWRGQHQPVFLENGHILVFDNSGGNRRSYFHRNRSKIIEIDPLTQKIHWEYRKDDGDDVFFTHWLGYHQRLPNGNTLITESTQGHIFEVTPDNEIVWEYYNPNRTGENDALIATVMGAMRIESETLAFMKSTSTSPDRHGNR